MFLVLRSTMLLTPADIDAINQLKSYVISKSPAHATVAVSSATPAVAAVTSSPPPYPWDSSPQLYT